MKRVVSIRLAFAAFSGIVPITSALAQTSVVVAQTRENAVSTPLPSPRPLSQSSRGSSAAARERARKRHQRADSPSREMPQCAPDDRKCEVEHKLKGLGSDPGKGDGF
jgi:hypothetical protein